MTREELIKSKEYIISGIQLNLLNLIENYMNENNLNRIQLASKLGVTKGYVSQLLNVSYDHKISKFVELALSCNTIPLLYFVDLDSYIKNDAANKVYEIFPIMRARNMTFEETNNIVNNENYPISKEEVIQYPLNKSNKGYSIGTIKP